MKRAHALALRASIAGVVVLVSAAYIASLASAKPSGALDPRGYAKRLEALIAF